MSNRTIDTHIPGIYVTAMEEVCIKLPQGRWRNSGLRPAAYSNTSALHQTKHHSGRIQGYQGTKGGPVKGSVNWGQGVGNGHYGQTRMHGQGHWIT